MLLAGLTAGCGAVAHTTCDLSPIVHARHLDAYPRASAPTPIERDGVIGAMVPADWQSLPRSSVRYVHRAGGTRGIWIDGDTIVRATHQDIVAHDAATGRWRWEQEGYWADHAVGCHRVFQVRAAEVRALDVDTGEELWRRTGFENLQNIVGISGCRVVVATDFGLREWAHAPLELAVLDAMHGELLTWQTLAQPGFAGMSGANDVRIWFSPAAGDVLLVPVGGGPARWAAREVGQASGDQLLIDDGSPVGWTADDVVVRTEAAVHRVSVSDGREVWRAAVPASVLDHTRWAVDESRAVATSNTVPPLVIDIDDTGRTALRLAPFRAHGMARQGDLLVMFDEVEWAALDLATERPPLRSERSLEEDVSRALARLTGFSPPSDRIVVDEFPESELEARDWLRRTRDLVRPAVVSAIERAPDASAATWADLLARDDHPLAADSVVALLERTWGAPTPERILLRTRAARAVTARLPARVAERLADETIRWASAREPTVACDPRPVWRRSSPLSPPRVGDALMAALSALERASDDPEPVRRVRRHLFGASTPACSGPDDDVCAAVRWASEVGVPFDSVDFPGLSRADGSSIPRRSSRPLLIFRPAAADEPAASPATPARTEASLTLWMGGPGQNESVTIALRRVQGEWRVVAILEMTSFVV